MKVLKRSVTLALLLFVGATVGVLIAQEVSQADAALVEEDRSVDAAEASTEPTSPVVATDSSVPDAEKTEVDASSAVNGETESDAACVVDAIYFHNTVRCYTCKNIEATAEAVVEEEFAEQFASGRMRWSAINMERHQQYVEEFDLVKPTLILVRTVGGEQSDWVALDETWSLIRSEARFSDYVLNETRAFLEGCP